MLLATMAPFLTQIAMRPRVDPIEGESVMMVQATDSASSSNNRRAWLVLAIVLVFAGAGCAKLRTFRKVRSAETPPAFGTEMSEHGTKSGDIYADHVAPSLRKSKEALARADGAPKEGLLASADSTKDRRGANAVDDSGAIRTRADKEPQIALRPPIAIPSVNAPVQGNLVAKAETVRHTGIPKVKSEPALEPLSIPDEPLPVARREPDLTMILAESRLALEGLTTYRVNMTHQQRIGIFLQPPEDVVMCIRRRPKAVRLEWPTGASQGREVLYAADSGGGQMHVKMPNPLLPRISMAPDGPMAVRSSRHPITEAGFDTIIAGLEAAVQAPSRGDTSYGKIQYVGLETPPGLDKLCQKIVRVAPDKENWVVYIDPENHLPCLVQATAPNGDLLERHVFRELEPNVAELTGRNAFDADARWGPNIGFLQRLAGAPPSTDASTRTR